MRRNPVFGYGIIAVIGILAVIVISFVGVDIRDKAESADAEGTEQTAEASTDPEEIYANNCSACHGADLSGGAGPELTTIGSSMSAEEINDIIVNGRGAMPAQSQLAAEEVDLLVEWLGEHQ